MIELEDLGVLESDNEYVIEAIGHATVIQLRFDYAVTLCIQGLENRIFRLRLQSNFHFRIDDVWQEVNPENISTCYSIFKLHQDIVISSSVLKSGELRMAFKSGAELVVGVDKDYESWEFGMRTEFAPGRSWLMICMPGGEIAVF